MSAWFQDLSSSTSENIQLGWIDKGGPNYMQEFSVAKDNAQFQGQEDAINAWMWKHHPLRAYFKVNAFGSPIFVSGKQALIASTIGSVFIYMKFLH